MESVKTKKIHIFTKMIPGIWAQVLEQEVKSLKKGQSIFSSMKSLVKYDTKQILYSQNTYNMRSCKIFCSYLAVAKMLPI